MGLACSVDYECDCIEPTICGEYNVITRFIWMSTLEHTVQ